MQILIDQVVDRIANDIKSKIEEVKSNCDSPIEEIVLMFLLSTFIEKHESDLNFQLDEEWPLDTYSSHERRIRRKKFDYRHEGILPGSYRYSGFQCPLKYITIGTHTKEGFIARYDQDFDEKIIIEPQHMVSINDSSVYFIDIAVYRHIYLKNDKRFIKENKIAIECDGHDYHSTKTQITSDNRRSRELIKNGWTVLRYSGSEIYEESKSELNDLTNEIIEIFDSI